MKCLLIEDDPDFSQILRRKLSLYGHVVDIRENPTLGIQAADTSKNYDIVFIDFKFDNEPNLTGADVGLTIRKNHPLSTLILMTAYGPDHIKDLAFVGFDGYWAKYNEGLGSNLDKMVEEFEELLFEAQKNAQKRVKSFFSQEELEDMVSYLNAIEQTIEFLEENGVKNIINCHAISAGISLLKKDRALEKKILQEVAVGDEKSRKKAQSKYDVTPYNYYSSEIFKLRDGRGGYTENALKVRQLLKDNPEKWLKAPRFNNFRGKPYYNPIHNIAKEFSV